MEKVKEETLLGMYSTLPSISPLICLYETNVMVYVNIFLWAKYKEKSKANSQEAKQILVSGGQEDAMHAPA